MFVISSVLCNSVQLRYANLKPQIGYKPRTVECCGFGVGGGGAFVVVGCSRANAMRNIAFGCAAVF